MRSRSRRGKTASASRSRAQRALHGVEGELDGIVLGVVGLEPLNARALLADHADHLHLVVHFTSLHFTSLHGGTGAGLIVDFSA